MLVSKHPQHSSWMPIDDVVRSSACSTPSPRPSGTPKRTHSSGRASCTSRTRQPQCDFLANLCTGSLPASRLLSIMMLAVSCSCTNQSCTRSILLPVAGGCDAGGCQEPGQPGAPQSPPPGACAAVQQMFSSWSNERCKMKTHSPASSSSCPQQAAALPSLRRALMMWKACALDCCAESLLRCAPAGRQEGRRRPRHLQL